MSDKKVFNVNNCGSYKSTELFSLLHCCDEKGEHLYDYLLFNNALKVWRGDSCYNVSLYFKRLVLGDKYVSDGLVFTEFKIQILGKEHFEKYRENSEIMKTIYQALDTLLSRDDDIDELFFDVPVCINAQNRQDKPSAHTRFGETTAYIVCGVKFSHYFSL